MSLISSNALLKKNVEEKEKKKEKNWRRKQKNLRREVDEDTREMDVFKWFDLFIFDQDIKRRETGEAKLTIFGSYLFLGKEW
jgi:hypothetical protein